MEKYKWIAQDGDGEIVKVTGKPILTKGTATWRVMPGDMYRIVRAKTKGMKIAPTRIDLKEFDYKIRDGILCSVAKPEPHVHQKVIKAWADGAIIQYKYPHRIGWNDCKDNEPEWSTNVDYRVKPKHER